ncbi:uncharacterized protein LOC120351614 [Nilaparvata lugens]|uniref:uncharacterized protein LOC120351614 n=1 Tax=Nilaparvata lugens TaxID=108931 RepID=UPI00193D5EB6|nr:uncharacterized protein LOC120351614 [Nilaparvata lugens]
MALKWRSGWTTGADIHSHNTRNREIVRLDAHRTTFFEASPQHMAKKVYNAIPIEIREMNSEIVFKKKLKLWSRLSRYLDFYFAGICTHIRSYQYYIGSLYDKEPSYIAAKCESYSNFQNSKCCDLIINMGEYVDFRAKGKFFLYTHESLPFGMGKKGISERCWQDTNGTSSS